MKALVFTLILLGSTFANATMNYCGLVVQGRLKQHYDIGVQTRVRSIALVNFELGAPTQTSDMECVCVLGEIGAPTGTDAAGFDLVEFSKIVNLVEVPSPVCAQELL